MDKHAVRLRLVDKLVFSYFEPLVMTTVLRAVVLESLQRLRALGQQGEEIVIFVDQFTFHVFQSGKCIITH